MAQKFSGAARARGFAPVQVSDANIARMREDNKRILDNMRARREAIRENDERQLASMEGDAAYREKANRRNYNIADANVRTQRQQAEFDAAARQNEILNQQKGLETMLNGVAKFSSTLSGILKEKEKKQTEEDQDRGAYYRMIYGGQDAAQIAANNGIRIETEARVEIEGTLAIAEAQGAPANEVSKTRRLNANEAIGWLRADSKLKADLKYNTFLQKEAKENPDIISSPEAFAKATKDIFIKFAKENNIPLKNPELVGPALDSIQGANKTFYSGLVAKQTEENNTRTREIVTDAALADWDEQGLVGFGNIKGLDGPTAAHAWFKKLATAMDEEGNFLIEDVQWQNFDPHGTGVPYFIPGKGRGAHEVKGVDIANTRADMLRDWNKNQKTTENQEYQEKSKAWYRHITVDGNNKPGDIAAAEKVFQNDIKGEPEWLTKLKNAGGPSQGPYNVNLITQAKDFEARGILYQELVDKVYERDSVLGNTLQESLNKQDPFAKNDRYTDLLNIVEKMPAKKDKYGDYPQDSVSSYNDSKALTQSYKELVRNGVADGSNIDDAATNAGKAIQSGFKDPKSPFYREYNPTTGFYEFPNLYQKTAKEIADTLDQADEIFAKHLASGKIQNMFSDPNIIITDAQYEQQVADMNSPGFIFHPRIDMIVQSGFIKGSHMDILQRIGKKKGKPPILPPPSLRVITEYPPDSQKMWALWGSRSSNIEARFHGAGQKNLDPEKAMVLVPETYVPNLRRFYRSSAERHGISPAENAAMGEIESTHGKFMVSYNGTSEGPMMINKSAHKDFYAKHGGKPSAEDNIDYGTGYYAILKRRYNNDPIAAAMAYNGGSGHYEMWLNNQKPAWVKTESDEAEWDRVVDEMTNHGKKFARAYYKYSGDNSLLQNPLLLRN